MNSFFFVFLLIAGSPSFASPPLQSLGDQIKSPSRAPASASSKDLRFSDAENLEDASIPEPISARPQFEDVKSDEKESVHFGKVDFDQVERVGDESFHALTEKLKKDYARSKQERVRKQNPKKRVRRQQLANARDVLNMSKKVDQDRVLATDRADVSRGSEFIFHSMCKHIDSYEKSNEIRLGTSICPER